MAADHTVDEAGDQVRDQQPADQLQTELAAAAHLPPEDAATTLGGGRLDPLDPARPAVRTD